MGKDPQKREKILERLRHLRNTAVLSGLTFLSTVFPSGKVNAQNANVKDSQKTGTENTITPKSTRNDTTVFRSAFSKDEVLFQELVNQLSDDHEFVANLLEEQGLNTLSNFNFKGYEWTAEDLKDLKNDGPMTQKLKANLSRVQAADTKGGGCLHATKKGLLLAAGFNCSATSPYQMPKYLNNSDLFVETTVHDNPKNSWSHDYNPLKNAPYLTLVMQNKNEKYGAMDGHSCFLGVFQDQSKDNPGQICGSGGPKHFPVSDRRNAYSFYNGYRSWSFSDSHVTEELLVKLVKEERCTIRIDSLIKAYIIDNPQIASQYGININAFRTKKSSDEASVVKKSQQPKSDIATPDDNIKDYAASNYSVKTANKPQRDRRIFLKDKELAAYLRKIRNRV